MKYIMQINDNCKWIRYCLGIRIHNFSYIEVFHREYTLRDIGMSQEYCSCCCVIVVTLSDWLVITELVSHDNFFKTLRRDRLYSLGLELYISRVDLQLQTSMEKVFCDLFRIDSSFFIISARARSQPQLRLLLFPRRGSPAKRLWQ